ncbi:hypothetical protein TBS_25030 [Thermobispora bispora]|mgnify:FL=1|uniref:SIS domain-containing protein n=1 Tax=Thermobispora bispora TaxID=2006 RepID=UPI0030E84728
MSGAAGAPEDRFDPDRLDDPSFLEECDSSGALRTVASSAAQVRVAFRAALEAGVPRIAEYGRPRAIVVAGMGVAGVAGEALEAVCGRGCPVPILTVRRHLLPGWVGAADLVAVTAGSARSEEALAVAADAVRRGCVLLGVGPEDSPLREAVARAGGPYVAVAQGHRPTLWELAVPLIVAAGALRIAEMGEAVAEAVAARLEDIAFRCRPSSESFLNPGKSFAMELADRLPLLWGCSPLARVAARSLACRLHRCAGYPALVGEIPEAGHEQIGLFNGPFGAQPIDADPFGEEGGLPRPRLFLFRDTEEHPLVAERREAVARLAEDRGVPVSEVSAEGAHPLERLASLIGLSDYAGVYLALGYGRDPSRIAALAELGAH